MTGALEPVTRDVDALAERAIGFYLRADRLAALGVASLLHLEIRAQDAGLLQRGDGVVERRRDQHRETARDQMGEHVALIFRHAAGLESLQLQPEHAR